MARSSPTSSLFSFIVLALCCTGCFGHGAGDARMFARGRATATGTATVSNVLPRRDVNTGQILDIHDGNTMRIGDTFYWYGSGYGNCVEMSSGCASIEVGSCGFNLNHTVNLATSTDLENWTLHPQPVLDPSARPEGIMFSPWVAYSPATKLYILWYNMLPTPGGRGDFDAAFYAVAVSPTPEGPFRTVKVNVTGLGFTRLPDAPSIFVDDDGSGYVAFTHEDSHINNVQQLTPDLLGPLVPGGKISAQVGDPNNEGILMFKRNGLYYVMFGACCCFCGEGTGVVVYTAQQPLGPYTSRGQIARNVTTGASIWQAQTGSVWFTGADYVLFGDRWQSAPDHIKAHDFSYWTPLTFNDDGSVQPIVWQDTVTIRY